jgi:hypothetical protein
MKHTYLVSGASEPINNTAKGGSCNPSPLLAHLPGNSDEALGKIVPKYRTFQYRKCLGVLRNGSQNVSITER